MGVRPVVSARLAVALIASLAVVVTGQPVVVHAAAARPSPSPTPSPAAQAARPAASQPATFSHPGINSAHFDPARSKEVPTLSLDSKQFDNPDGTHTLRVGAGPIKGQDAAGAVGDLDLSLVVGGDGRLHPHRATTPISIAAASGPGMATVELAPGKAVSLDLEGIASGVAPQRAPGPLGETAHFDRVLAQGTSLELRPLSSGIESTYVVGSAAAAGGLTERLTLPAGYSARQGNGFVDLLDDTGALAGRWAGGMATDSSPRQLGTPVILTLARVSSQQVTANVVVDIGWLNDPARVYPVRVDPVHVRESTNQVNGSGATYIQSGASGSPPPQWQGQEIRAGTWDGGSDVARSLIQYLLTGVPANSRIVSATMSVYEFWSYSCTASPLVAHQITSAWDGGSTTWSNQPSFNGGPVGSVSTALGWSSSGVGGPSSCAANWVPIDVSGLVGAWYFGQATNWGVELTAGNESDSNSWKRFAGGGTNSDPVLDITYESYGTNPVQIDDANKQPPSSAGGGWQGMTLVNQGSDPWPANGIYKISYHVYSATGQLINYEGVRTLIPSTVNPGGSVYLQANIGALPMGDYILAWDMVEEGVTWFSSSGVAPVNRSYHSDQPPSQAALTSPGNPYIQAPALAAMQGGSARSLELWFSTTNTSQQPLVDAGNTGAGIANQAFLIELTQQGGVGGSPPANGQGLILDLSGQTVYLPGPSLATSTWTDGRPHHLVVTLAGSAVSIFVDAAQPSGLVYGSGGWSGTRAQPFNLASPPNTAANPIWFGHSHVADFGIGATYFSGVLDEIAVYDKALAPDRVSAHFTAGSGYKNAVTNDSPVAYYRLDDASRAPSVADSSGHGNSASWSGGATTGVAGATNDGDTSMSFDGSSGEVDTAYLQNGVTAFSVEAWVKTTDGGANRAIVQDRGGSSGSGPGQSLTLGLDLNTATATGPGDPFFILDANGAAIGVWSPRAINDGKWHHVVGTWAGSAGSAVAPGQFALYVDGAAMTTNQVSAGSATAPLSGSGGTKIARHDAWNTFLGGSVDEVAVYGIALSGQQVQTHFGAVANANYRSKVLGDLPLVYYRLDDPAAATTLADGSGHGATAGWSGGAGTRVPGLISGDSDQAMSFGANLPTLTPTLQASSSDPDGPHLQFLFRICTGADAESGQCADSGWIDQPAWMVPAGRLTWGVTYYWHTWVRDNSPGPYGQVAPPPAFSLTPTLPATREEWSFGANPYASLRGGVNTAIGGYTYANTDFSIATVGPPLQVVRTYNSRDQASNPLGSWFGRGWTSTYETNVTFDAAGNATVTYPDGRREFLPGNGDGSYFSPAFGFTSSMTTVHGFTVSVGGGPATPYTQYQLKHKDQSVWTFRSDGRLDSIRDAAGHVVQLTWNNSSVVIVDQTSGRTLTAVLSGSLGAGGRVTSIVTSPVTIGGSQQALTWTYTYDANNQLSTACDPTDTPSARVCTTYSNTGPGNMLSSVTLPNGNTLAALTYDGSSRVQTRKDGMGNSTTFAYSKPDTGALPGVSAIATVTDALNHATKDYYDALNQLTGHVDEDGSVRGFTYDQSGFVNSITDENGSRTSYVNDPANNVLQVKDGAGDVIYYSYDPKNNLSVVRDARSSGPTDDTYKVARGYDASGHLTSEQTPAGTRTWTYTTGSEAAVGGGSMPAGLLLNATDAMGHATTCAYDVAGNLRKRTDPSGLVTEYTYDELGRQLTRKETSDSFPGGLVSSVAYDLAGRAITITEPGVKNTVTGVTHQRSTTLGYDRNGSLRTATVNDPTGGDASRKTSYDYDNADRLITVTDPLGHASGRTYDAVGDVIKTTDELGRTTQIDYTVRGQVQDAKLLGFIDDPINPGTPRDVTLASYTYDPGGRTKTQTDALGRTRRLDYDGADRLTAVTLLGFHNADGSTRDIVLETRGYDLAGHLLRRVEAGLRTTDTAYDPAGRLITSAVYAPSDGPSAARTVTYGYDANGNVLSRTLSQAGADHAEQVSYHYDLDQADRLDKVTVTNDSPGNAVTGYTLDQRGLPTATTDPLGNVTNTTYDEAGRPSGSVAPSVQVESGGSTPSALRPAVAMGYDTFGEPTQLRDPRASLTSFTYDAAGRRIGAAYPTYVTPGGATINATESWAYDAAGNLLRRTDRRGQATTYDYDMRNRVVRQTDPLVTGQSAAGVERFTYDDAGNLTSLVDQVGARQESTYDDLNRANTHTVVERVPAPAARLTWGLGHDDLGRLTSQTSPLNETTAWQYDALGGLLKTTDATGQVTTVTRDLADRPLTVTDPLGRRLVLGYDKAGHQTRETRQDPSGATLSTLGWQYDLSGNVITATDAAGTPNKYYYDALNRLLQINELVLSTCGQVCTSQSITTNFGYDASGNRTRVTDGNGHATVMSYNAYDLLESQVEPATTAQPNLSDRTWTLTYNAGGLPTTEAQPGLTIASVYDELGRPTRRTGGSTASTYGWDLAGNLTSATGSAGGQTFTYDDRGLVATASGIAGNSSFGYDADGRVTSRVDAAGTTTYSWTPRGELRTATDPLTGVQQTLTYDAASQLEHIDYGSGGPVRDYGYDGLGQLTSDAVKNAGGTVFYQAGYLYDANGNLKQKTLGAGQAGAGTQTYGYDLASRLTSWTGPSGTTTSYAWDNAGNRTQAGGQTYTYDERNRLLSGGGTTYTWSANGNLLTAATAQLQTSYTYDGLNRLTQVTGSATTAYAYDGLDRMVERNQTAFAYAGASTKPSSDGSFTYARTPDDTLLALSDGQHPALAAQGPHGDVELTLNATGSTSSTAAYDPFGGALGGSPSSRLGYQGEWTDPTTAQTWMAARWYDSTSGRFLTRDSIQSPLLGAVDTNRYTYGRANPLGYADPSGHCPTWVRIAGFCEIWDGFSPSPPPKAPLCQGGPSEHCPDDLGIPPSDDPTQNQPQPKCPGDPSCEGQTGGGKSQTSSYQGSGCDFQCRLAQLLKNAPPAPYLPPPPGTRGIVKNPDPVPTSGVTTLAPAQGMQQAASSRCGACTDLRNLPTSFIQGLIGKIDPRSTNPDTGQPDGLDKCLPRSDGSNAGTTVAVCTPKGNYALNPECAFVTPRSQPLLPAGYACSPFHPEDFISRLTGFFEGMSGKDPGEAGDVLMGRGVGGAAEADAGYDARVASNPATGRYDASRSTYDKALAAARENAGDLGPGSQVMYDPETGTQIGEQSANGRRGWRIDQDHVNWWDWSTGKKGSGGRFGHEFFPESQSGPHSKYIGYAPWEPWDA